MRTTGDIDHEVGGEATAVSRHPRWIVFLASLAALATGAGIGWGLSWGLTTAEAARSTPTASVTPTPTALVVGLVRAEPDVLPTQSSGPSSPAPSPSGTQAGATPAEPSRDPETVVATTLNNFLTAINENRPEDAYALYAPDLRKRIGSYEAWAGGYSSTIHRQADIRSITPDGGGKLWTIVDLVSEQDPAHSPDEKSPCLVWRLTYVVAPTSGGGIINDVRMPTDRNAYAPCTAE